MLGVSLIIIAAAIVYMVETYISTYYTIEYMHGTSLFLILLAKYGTPVLFLLLCAYIAYRNFLKSRKLRLLLHLNGLQAKKSCIPTKFKRQ